MGLCSPTALVVPLAGIIAGLFVGTAAARAQEAAASVIATVSAAQTGAGLVGAEVSITGTRIRAVTGPDGVARLEGVPTGTQTVQVRRIGYATALRLVALEAGQPAAIAIPLRVEVVALPEIRVRAKARPTYLDRVGYSRRQARGPGEFVSRAQIEKQRPRFLSDILRSVPGVGLSANRMGGDSRAGMTRASAGGARRCPIQYFVDGVQTWGFNIDDVPPRDVEGLEIYKGASQIPAEFNRGSAMCGVILIWTRIGR